jgi:hypothetical protein
MEALTITVIDYGKVKYTLVQSKLIDEISALLCMIIQIPEVAMKGIVWKALRAW